MGLFRDIGEKSFRLNGRMLSSAGSPKTKPFIWHRREPGSKPVFLLRPDILFTRPTGHTLLILDTKYKVLDPSTGNRGVSEADIYQMLAYEVRFNCKNTLVVYPSRNKAIPVRDQFSFYKDVGDIKVATINLHQSLSAPKDLIFELQEIFSSISPVG